MKILLVVIAAFATTLFAGENLQLMKQNKNTFSAKKMTSDIELFEFNFNQQKYQLMEEIKIQTRQEASEELQKKSGIKAVLLSALVPGAGEFYAESYWKSALFGLIEIAAWSGYIVYEDKGDSKDLEMRRFGDTKWSEQHYWSRVYDRGIEAGIWEGPQLNPDSDHILPPSEVEANIDLLRNLESNNNFSYFSHTLPRTKTQQYYEMIYKYPSQFGAGWIELSEPGGKGWDYYDSGLHLDSLTPDVNKYKKMRNLSNDFYATATNMATIVLLNHLASAIDAAFTVKSYNAQLKYSFYAGQKHYAGERVNTYGLALSW